MSALVRILWLQDTTYTILHLTAFDSVNEITRTQRLCSKTDF